MGIVGVAVPSLVGAVSGSSTPLPGRDMVRMKGDQDGGLPPPRDRLESRETNKLGPENLFSPYRTVLESVQKEGTSSFDAVYPKFIGLLERPPERNHGSSGARKPVVWSSIEEITVRVGTSGLPHLNFVKGGTTLGPCL